MAASDPGGAVAEPTASSAATQTDTVPDQLLPLADEDFEHERTLSFDSPAEILDGAWPDEPAYVYPQLEQRSARGLPADRELVAALVTAPGSVQQAQEFGVVLSQEEQEQVILARSVEEFATTLSERLRVIGGYGGTRIRWAGTPMFSEPSLSVYVVEPQLKLAEEIIIGSQSPVDVDVQVVRSSLRDLRGFVAMFYGREMPEGFDGNAAMRLVAEQIRMLDPVSVGYSLVENRIEVEVETEQLPPSVDIKGSPMVVFAHVNRTSQLFGKAPCGSLACHPVRAGVGAKLQGGGTTCTFGFAVVASFNESWLTSGHCATGTYEAAFTTGSSGGVSSYGFFFTVFGDQVVGTTGANGDYTGSRLDAQIVTESDYLVTNRLRTGPNTSARIDGFQPYGAGIVGMTVCHSGWLNSGCGMVQDIGRSHQPTGQNLLLDQIEVLPTSGNLASAGDSGGPVYVQSNPRKAFGIIRGEWSPTEATVGSVSFLGDLQSGLTVYTTSDRRRDFVLGMYENGLGRFADSGGYSFFRGRLNSCTLANAQYVAKNILKSPEFRNKYPVGTLGERQIRVELAYWSIMGRASDAGGLNYWTGVATTESGWTTVVNSFVASAEFSSRVFSGASAYDGDVC